MTFGKEFTKAVEQKQIAQQDAERARFTDLLDSLQVDPSAAETLRTASRRVDDLRFEGVRATQG